MDNVRSKPVGIWLRVSTEDQAKGESPEHHEKRARFYAESKGWRVKEVYHLEAVSGKSVREHPETQRMLADVRRGHITGLIFSKLARLARNTRELLDFADFFRDAGADLISLQESIDTSSPAGRLFYTVIAAMAQWEREEISARVAASVPIRAKLGKPLGGAAPFGYRWQGRELVPDAKEAPVRKRIYELFLEHRRKKAVARILNDEGLRTRNGSRFTDTTIDRLIRDPTAKGERRANYTKSLGDKKHWVLKPRDQWVVTRVESVVSPELWERCNRILDERRKNGKRPGRRPVHLFTGLVHCHCGQKMYVPSNTPKYVCYGCRNKIPVDDLDAVFHEQLQGFVLSPKEIAAYIAQADEKIGEKQTLLSTLEEDRRKVRAEMDRVMRLYLDEKISGDGFASEYGPLETRFKQLSDQIPEIQGELDFLKIRALSSDEILTEAKDLYGRWRELTREEKRKIVETITEKITVGKEDVTIDLCYLPSSSEFVTEKQRNFTDSSQRRASPRPETSACPSRARL
jgi:site-specific DNA recombinase